MDNNNNLNISFVGYAGGSMKKALKNRTYAIHLEDFYKAVNQDTTSGCCSCCKKETIIYAILPVLLPIKATALSICYECLRSLPLELTVTGVDCNGAPAQLIDRKYVRWV
ncbi:hypothetical protein [Clostridium sp.]|uniref:hypothetical protein n=1 Tax=Clostridium sp. TaxID=1506 RepID=UPI00284001F4|nr:hypothetical protein [Clostridium sp.]MDR3597093.1 hypothetical protein [Clostridium sp.]